MNIHNRLTALVEDIRFLAAIDLDQLDKWESLYEEDRKLLKMVKKAYLNYWKQGNDREVCMPPDGSQPYWFNS